jgi:hypothetical protein
VTQHLVQASAQTIHHRVSLSGLASEALLVPSRFAQGKVQLMRAAERREALPQHGDGG